MITPADKATARAGFARATELDQQIRARYPSAWQQLDHFRANPPMPWADWCLLPMAASAAVVSQGAPMHTVAAAPPSGQQIAALAAMYAWRYSRSVFLLHPELASQLVGKVPDDLSDLAHFTGLPNWCTYLPAAHPQRPGLGLWIHLEFDTNTSRPELRLLLDLGGTIDDLLPIPVYLDRPTLTEALADFMGTALATRPVDGPVQFGQDVRGAELERHCRHTRRSDGRPGRHRRLPRPTGSRHRQRRPAGRHPTEVPHCTPRPIHLGGRIPQPQHVLRFAPAVRAAREKEGPTQCTLVAAPPGCSSQKSGSRAPRPR
jgi:hypothetical protein